MALVVTLTEVKIIQTIVQVDRGVVIVDYEIEDDTGNVWKRGRARFWETMPAEPTDEDYQLGSSHLAALQSLISDADTAITNREISP